jgi:hypothetical protein
MHNAIIGDTGFVGGNLCRQQEFSKRYNSRNIESIQGESFDEIICAGMPAAKWIANQRPQEDLEILETLKSCLTQARADRFTLISTVDVYANPTEVDESISPDTSQAHAYGLHRYWLEEFVRERFPDHLIVRLPGLFGFGLKKNVIYDLIHKNQVEKIDAESAYQYYDLKHMGADLKKTRNEDLRLIHLTSEPIKTRMIAERLFPQIHLEEKPSPHARYDFRTRHAALWGQKGGYQYPAESVLDDLTQFLRESDSCV